MGTTLLSDTTRIYRTRFWYFTYDQIYFCILEYITPGYLELSFDVFQFNLRKIFTKVYVRSGDCKATLTQRHLFSFGRYKTC